MKNRLISLRLVVPGLFAALLAGSGPAAADPESGTTEGFRDEIKRAPEPYRGPPRSGAQVYDYRCKACHARATQGAPMPGDQIDWGIRARQGVSVLMAHVRNGYKRGLMPAHGGCANCSDSELRAAVVYMLEKSNLANGELTGDND